MQCPHRLRRSLTMFTIYPLVLAGALVAAGTAEATNAPNLATAYDYNTNSLIAYYVGGTGSLYSIDYPYGSPGSRLSGVAGHAPLASGSGLAAYMNTIDNQREAFYLTAIDGQMHVELVWGESLASKDLTRETGATPALPGSSLAGYADTCAGTNNLFYIGRDLHVHALRWTPVNGWQTEDVTHAAGGARVSGTSLVTHESAQSEEVFYLDSEHHVQELWRRSGCPGLAAYDGWHAKDLTTASGAPDSAPGTALTSFFDDLTPLDAVIFVDADQHLHELYRSAAIAPADVWVDVDMTRASSSPAAAAGTSLATLLWAQGPAWIEAVYYVDAHSNVWELSSDPLVDGTVNWNGVNVTAAAHAQVAEPGTALAADVNHLCAPFCEVVDYLKEVYYVGADHSVYLLQYSQYLQPSGWNRYGVTVDPMSPH